MKIFKKSLSFLMAFVMLTGIIAGINFQAIAETSDYFEYTILEDGTVEITGYTKYHESETNLIIPSTLGGHKVSSIGSHAFQGVNSFNIVNITIPNGVTKICSYAFASASQLETISIPESVITIEHNAFLQCVSLVSITIPNSVTSSIGRDTFQDCDNLQKVIIGDNVEKVEDGAFSFCDELSEVIIGDGVKSIERNAFEYCSNLNSVVIGENVENISEYVFSDCSSLTNINIPKSVNSLERGVFFNCSNLKNVIISGNIKELDAALFSGCSSLISISIPDSITEIKEYAFNNCSSLSDVYYLGDEKQWQEIKIENFNQELANATIHFNSTGNSSITYAHNSFSSADKTFSGEFGYYYKDSYFAESANKYNQSLATMSLCLSLSTYNASDNYENADENVRTILNQCGFQDYEQTMYHIKPESGTIAFSIANKELDTGETLIAVAVRSGGYEAEWASNVTVGKTGNHEGFQNAADCVYRVLNNYITDSEHNLSNKKVKFWITGYSRGAAVSNILAAKLFQEKYKEVTYSSINDVYAYCFATPAGVSLTEDPHNDCYNNIFNIIEYNDPVPLVAPCQWDFDRYGITKVLPCAESTKDAFNYINPMIEQLNAMGYEYKVSDFRSAEIGNPFVPNNDTLGTFLRKRLCDDGPGALVPFVLGSRTNYVNMYQQDAINAMPVENITNLLFDFYFQLPYFITWSTLHGTTVKTLVDNMDLLAYVHENQAVYLAWMQSMDNNYVNNAKTYFSNGDYRAAKINCPVDVYVYDSDNNLVASIINETPQKIENSSIISSIDENNQKIIYLPCDEEYHLKIIAREDCETTYTVNEYTGVDSQVSRIVSYSEINMEKDDLYEASVDRYSDDEIANGAINGTDLHYTFEGTNGVMNADLDVSGDQVENYTYNVELKCDDEKGSVLGGGTYRKGDFCQIVATNSIGYIFDGWYVDNEKLSSINVYRFAVNENVSIEARFIACKHSNLLSEEIEATCTKQGFTKYSCQDCGYSYNEDYKPALGHTYDNGKVTKDPTCTSSGVMTYSCTVCGVEYMEVIPATGHQYGAWTVVKEATETEEGLRERVCSVCGVTESEVIPVLTTETSDNDEIVSETEQNSSNITENTDSSLKSPKTGNDLTIIGTVLMMIFTLSTIAIIIIRCKRTV